MKRYIPIVMMLIAGSSVFAGTQPFMGETLSEGTLTKIQADGKFVNESKVNVSLIRTIGSPVATQILVEFENGASMTARMAGLPTLVKGACATMKYSAVYEEGAATASTSAKRYEHVDVVLNESKSGKCSSDTWTLRLTRQMGGYQRPETFVAQGTPEFLTADLVGPNVGKDAK